MYFPTHTRVIDAPVRAQNSLRDLPTPVIRFDYRKNRISAWLSRNIYACRQGDFCVNLTHESQPVGNPTASRSLSPDEYTNHLLI